MGARVSGGVPSTRAGGAARRERLCSEVGEARGRGGVDWRGASAAVVIAFRAA